MRAKLFILMVGGAISLPVSAQQNANATAPRIEAPVMIADPYTAYDFLIGDWYSKPAGGPDLMIHQNFRWGPKKSYIFYTTSTAMGSGPEEVHFEGMAVWNGRTKDVDYLVVSEPGSGAQEQGTIHSEQDGSITREVLLTRPDGKTQQFRQKFWKRGPDSAETSLMRKTATGWEPNFPGSDHITMSRQKQ